MKKALIIIAIILGNLVLIFIALLIQYRFSEKIIRTTYAPREIETFVFILITLAGLIFFFLSKKFRPIGIGATALTISGLIFLIFYLNKSLATKGEYEDFKLRSANWTDKGFFLNIAFNNWYNSTKVTQEKCLTVDSVQVRIDDGLFGFQTMTNDIRIVESSNCDHIDLDSTNLTQSHLAIGHNLAKKRCFTAAIYHYSTYISIDSLNPDVYYQRGLMYVAKEEYEKALFDFYYAAQIKYNTLDSKKIETIDKIELLSYTNELLDKIKAKDFEGISDFAENINTINDFDTYQKYIVFCIEKINEEN